MYVIAMTMYYKQKQFIKTFFSGPTKTMDEARPEENRLSNALIKTIK